MTQGQSRALEELLPGYGVDHLEGFFDYAAIFGRQAEIILEIGFGMGQSLVAQAEAHPEINYLGIEVHLPGVGSLLNSMQAKGLENLRVSGEDAVLVLREHIQKDSLDGIQVFFPDPWHKKRHHKRRLIQPGFVRQLVERLKPGGFLHLATDWENYAEQMLEVLSAETMLQNTSETNDYVPRPESRPLTKFEQRGHRLGHGVWDLYFTRK
jgi:tRNA (guanine-N7-)-methyltransferase